MRRPRDRVSPQALGAERKKGGKCSSIHALYTHIFSQASMSLAARTSLYSWPIIRGPFTHTARNPVVTSPWSMGTLYFFLLSIFSLTIISPTILISILSCAYTVACFHFNHILPDELYNYYGYNFQSTTTNSTYAKKLPIIVP